MSYIVVVAVLVATATAAALAQSPHLYAIEGQAVRLLVGQPAGGVTDLETRLVARHLSKYLATTNIVVQDLPGAGGLRMLNYLAALDPATFAVAVVPSSTPFRARAGILPAHFDPRTVNWIGSFGDSTNVCLFSAASDVSSVADMRGRELTMGQLSAGGNQNAIRAVLNSALGLQLSPVIGYSSLATLALAVRRGEVDGFCSPYSAYATILAPLIDDGVASITLYLGSERRDDIGAPYLFDLELNPETEDLVRAAVASISFARPLAVPAGASPNFVAAMRDAFEALMLDQAFLDDARAQGFEVRPVSAASLTAAVERLYATPDATIAELAAFLFAE